MTDEAFDAIIVGAGPAGSAAATVLARAGLDVVLIDRGSAAGSKNLSGGRLYAHAAERVFPDFANQAPLERMITKERISLLTGESATTIDFTSTKLGGPHASYSVLRAPFDQWLAEQAEEAGATVVTGIRVDDLMLDNGQIRGVIAGDDEMPATVTLLADGALSLLARRAGLIQAPNPHHYAVGAKEVIELGEDVISQRFGVAPGEGVAWMFDGHPTDGHIGGGFLYTNHTSVSLGIVTTIGDLEQSDIRVPEMVERLKAHPVIAPLIAGGTLAEYGGHMALEGGYDAIPQIVHPGALILGDAAGLGLNAGYTIRGMDLAIESGRLAAETILRAKERNDYSVTSLNDYPQLLADSFVFKDLMFYRRFPDFLEKTRAMFTEYPRVAEEMLMSLFSVDGQEPEPITRSARAALSPLGIGDVARDAWRGVGAINGRKSKTRTRGAATPGGHA